MKLGARCTRNNCVFKRNKRPVNRKSNILAVLLATGVLHSYQAFAEEIAVPPGFYKLENGDIIVDDPTIAVAPEGYRINVGGMLVRDLNEAPKLKSVEKEPDPVDDPAKNQSASTEVPSEIPVVENSDDVTEIPLGFHRMPNGDIMANNPAKANAPEGYFINDAGVLKKIGEQDPAHNLPDMETKGAPATVDDFGGVIPPGYHKMPDGTIMANSPSRAVAPEGYHLMPDGTLMAHGTQSEHSMHSHGGGGMLMAEYVYERMYMDGYLDSTDEVSTQELLDTGGKFAYSMTGTDMTMDMHMFMFMYHTRTYMVMLMLHYMENEMGMIARDGTNLVKSTMKSKGIADTILTYQRTWQYNLGWTIGISLPTGSIDERGPMTHGVGNTTDEKYPYGMQLGSGTYDLIFGLDYQNTSGKMSWGADWQYTLRTGENDNDYRLGDKSVLDGWIKYMHTSTITSKGKLKWMEVGQIDGEDPELRPLVNVNMSPNVDAENYGGRRLDVVGLVKWENAQMTSVAAELTLPIYQNLFGPQMKTEWIVGLKFGYMF